MIHEMIIKDSRGTIRIQVKLWSSTFGDTDRSGNLFRYDVNVWHIAPKKRTQVSNPTIATEAEKYAAKYELWEKLKP